MSRDDRPDRMTEDGPAAEAGAHAVALVPLVPTVQWKQAPRKPPSRPDSTFVAHLIATAEQLPQTRNLRRATPADAQNAYTASQHLSAGGAIRTRHII